MKRAVFMIVFLVSLAVFSFSVLASCNDGMDNDDDGLVDFPADVDCDNETDNEYPIMPPLPECNDGMDNDDDGLVDFPADVDCDDENDVEFTEDGNMAGSQGCEEDWDCGDWGGCIDGMRYRECYDFSACGTEFNKPLEVAQCDGSGSGQQFLTGGGSGEMRYDLVFAWSAFAVSVVVLIFATLLLMKSSFKRGSNSLIESRKKMLARAKSQGKKQAS